MWTIVKQEVKDSMVDCKVLNFCPVKDKVTKELKGFMRIPPVVQVIIGLNGTETKLKWSPRGGVNGKWTMQMPDRMIHPTVRIGGRNVPDLLSEKVVVPGEKRSYASKSLFFSKLADKVGSELANQIQNEFEEKISEINKE